jgi:hypothetical protein
MDSKEIIAAHIDKLENRRAEILHILCERKDIWMPEILLSLVHETRTITDFIKMLKGEIKFGNF